MTLTMAIFLPGTSALHFQSGQGARTCKVGHCCYHYSFPKVYSWRDMMCHEPTMTFKCLGLKPKYTRGEIFIHTYISNFHPVCIIPWCGMG